MSNTIVLYFHGYGSSPRSDKVADLQRVFGDVQAPPIPVLFDDAQQVLDAFIEDLLKQQRTLIIVGTSLGGYWAGKIGAKYDIPAVLINPSVNPCSSLKKYKNEALTDNELSKFVALVPSSSPRIVLLAIDDDVIDPGEAMKLFADNAKVQCFPDGGHRFQCPERIADAVKYLIQYETSDICND